MRQALQFRPSPAPLQVRKRAARDAGSATGTLDISVVRRFCGLLMCGRCAPVLGRVSRHVNVRCCHVCYSVRVCSLFGGSTATRPILEEALEFRRRTLGPNHSLTLDCMWSLALTLEDLKDYGAAAALRRRCLECVLHCRCTMGQSIRLMVKRHMDDQGIAMCLCAQCDPTPRDKNDSARAT